MMIIFRLIDVDLCHLYDMYIRNLNSLFIFKKILIIGLYMIYDNISN